MAHRRGILAAGAGGFGAGLLLVAGGLIVRHTQANMLAKCSSGVGQFGQALNANAARQCASAQHLSSMATWATWVGGILLVIAAGSLIVFWATGRKPKVVVPEASTVRPAGPGRGAPARSRASEGAVLRPVALSAMGHPAVAGQPGALQAYPPGPGCGHEVDDGARFCMVCGRPAAGERGFASGSEITTVLPVFAPPEPVGVPAPATAADRTVERSLAGVAPGSQLSWADRPPAPGGVDSSPPWGWADPPPAPGGSVKSSPPWEQAGQSPAPGVVESGPSREQADQSPASRVVKSGPPREQAGQSPAPGVVKSGPPREQAGQSPAPGVVKSGPPWEQAGQSPASRVVKSGPPWDRAEPSPAPGGTGPGPEGIIPRQSGSGRHRSSRA